MASNLNDEMKRLYSNVMPAADLNEEVLARVHELRAAGAEAASEPGLRRAVTRRAVLAGGLACAAVASGLAFGLGGALTPQTAPVPFGLTIAQAGEADRAVAVEATDDGIMPIPGESETSRGDIELAFSLRVKGSNLTSVTYRIVGSPTDTRLEFSRPPYGPGQKNDYNLRVIDTVNLYSRDTGYQPNPDGSSADEEARHRSYGEFTADYRKKDGTGGDWVTDDGWKHWIVADGSRDFWQSDDTLALLHTWLSTGATADEFATEPFADLPDTTWRDGESAEEYFERIQEAFKPWNQRTDAAEARYHEAFDELATSDEALRDWMRRTYISAFTCANKQLSQAALEAEAHFADGSTSTVRYRISLVDNSEQVLSDRFDALEELSGTDLVAKARKDKLPWAWFVTPTREQTAADPRLSEPIYQIERLEG